MGTWFGLPGQGRRRPTPRLAAEDAASPPSGAAEQAERGDQWWEVAQEQQGAEREVAMRRARYWYEKARGGLEEGLAKALVESRLGAAKAGGM